MPKRKTVNTTGEADALRAENARLRSQLDEMRRFLDEVSDIASEMIWCSDAEHRFTFMSRSVVDSALMNMEKQLGKTRMELAGADMDSPLWRQHMADLDAHRPFEDFAYERPRPSGEVRHIRTSGRPVFDADGNFDGYVGVARDVTDEMVIAAKAESAEMKLFAAINALDSICALWDADDRLVLANDHFNRLNVAVADTCRPGTSFEEHLRAVVAKGLVPDIDDQETWIRERVERHRNPRGPVEVNRQNGMTLLITETKLADGSIFTLSSDITTLKRTENALRESEQRLRDFGRAAADWFWEMDAELRFKYISEDRHTEFGEPDIDFIGLTRRETGPEDVSEDALREHEETMLRREPFSDFRFSRTYPNGKKLYVSINGTPVFDADGSFVGYRGVGRDITDLVTAQEEIWQEKERAEQASRAKSQFLAHMSHELRTPLNAILGFSEIIRGQMFGPIGSDSYVDYANDIHSSGEHLLSLINDLLDLSKIEAGKFEIKDETLDLGEVTARSLRLFERKLADRNISVTTEIAAGASKLQADRRGVSQMVFNLLSNAEKFNCDGGRIAIVTRRGDDGGISLSISDTGCGFEVDEVGTAMAPFGRIDNPLTKAVPGTGLGLPIVSALMGMHGGAVDIESTVGKGTKATLRFPPSRTVRD